MEEYTFLRHLADSWGVVAMISIFLGIGVWAIRPGSNKVHNDIANSIFRNEDMPSDGESRLAKRTEA